MTAQISDTIIYKDRLFSIAGVNGTGLFNPADYGIEPVITSTACYRGFCCTYTVVDKFLQLNKVDLGLDLKNSLLIKHGRGGLKLFGQTSEDTISACGLHRYSSLNELIDFTGGLLTGTDFIRELSTNMGRASPYKFKRVIELIFESGQLIKSVDRSQQMSELRNFIDFKMFKTLSSEGKEKVEEWIREGLILDYNIH